MAALLRHHEKDLKELDKLNGKTKKRKNGKPEKLVEAECLFWMRQQRWSVQIVESKATFDPRRGVYRNQSVSAGTCDCMGTLPDGIAIYIEFKAPGKLKTFNREKNQRQIQYIKSKIEMNAFACVVDSAKLLEEIYITWRATETPEAKRIFLTKALP